MNSSYFNNQNNLSHIYNIENYVNNFNFNTSLYNNIMYNQYCENFNIKKKNLFEYICKINNCNKIFDTKTLLNNHKKTHKKDIYNLKFYKNDDLKFQIKLLCKVRNCNVFCYTISDFLNHRFIHNVGYTCLWKECGKIFYIKDLYIDHLDVHKIKKIIICPKQECGKCFSDKYIIFDHLNTHIDNKLLYTCPFKNCSAEINTKDNLINHVSTTHT
jgi:general transcription factor IIIA